MSPPIDSQDDTTAQFSLDRILLRLDRRISMRDQQGISNRESFAAEQQERMEHPPMSPDGPPVEQDAAGREGEEHPEANEGRHTSHKAGSRSIAQKESASKYADRSHPSSHKVAGADGKEPQR